jgi:hypothetical protein
VIPERKYLTTAVDRHGRRYQQVVDVGRLAAPLLLWLLAVIGLVVLASFGLGQFTGS